MGADPSLVGIGIDAAVTADHRVAVRRIVAGGAGEVIDSFTASPTLAGLHRLTERLSPYAGGLAVAETNVDDVAESACGVGGGGSRVSDGGEPSLGSAPGSHLG